MLHDSPVSVRQDVKIVRALQPAKLQWNCVVLFSPIVMRKIGCSSVTTNSFFILWRLQPTPVTHETPGISREYFCLDGQVANRIMASWSRMLRRKHSYEDRSVTKVKCINIRRFVETAIAPQRYATLAKKFVMLLDHVQTKGSAVVSEIANSSCHENIFFTCLTIDMAIHCRHWLKGPLGWTTYVPDSLSDVIRDLKALGNLSFLRTIKSLLPRASANGRSSFFFHAFPS